MVLFLKVLQRYNISEVFSFKITVLFAAVFLFANLTIPLATGESGGVRVIEPDFDLDNDSAETGVVRVVDPDMNLNPEAVSAASVANVCSGYQVTIFACSESCATGTGVAEITGSSTGPVAMMGVRGKDESCKDPSNALFATLPIGAVDTSATLSLNAAMNSELKSIDQKRGSAKIEFVDRLDGEATAFFALVLDETASCADLLSGEVSVKAGNHSSSTAPDHNFDSDLIDIFTVTTGPNTADREQSFAYLVQIQDSNGVAPSMVQLNVALSAGVEVVDAGGATVLTRSAQPGPILVFPVFNLPAGDTGDSTGIFQIVIEIPHEATGIFEGTVFFTTSAHAVDAFDDNTCNNISRAKIRVNDPDFDISASVKNNGNAFELGCSLGVDVAASNVTNELHLACKPRNGTRADGTFAVTGFGFDPEPLHPNCEPSCTGIFTGEVILTGFYADTSPGFESTATLNVNFNDDAECTLTCKSTVDGTVELDQKVYTWTDKVY